MIFPGKTLRSYFPPWKLQRIWIEPWLPWFPIPARSASCRHTRWTSCSRTLATISSSQWTYVRNSRIFFSSDKYSPEILLSPPPQPMTMDRPPVVRTQIRCLRGVENWRQFARPLGSMKWISSSRTIPHHLPCNPIISPSLRRTNKDATVGAIATSSGTAADRTSHRWTTISRRIISSSVHQRDIW